MGVFKWKLSDIVARCTLNTLKKLRNGNYSIDRILKILAVAALTLFIICSVFWLLQPPNRYQLIVGGVTGLIRMDTFTGKAEYLLPNLKTYTIKTTEELGFRPNKPQRKDIISNLRDAGFSDEEIENWLKENTIVGKIKRYLGIGSSPEIIPKGDLRFLPDQPKPKADEILGIKPKATDPNKIVDPYEEKTTTDFTPVAPVEKK